MKMMQEINAVAVVDSTVLSLQPFQRIENVICGA